MPFGCLFVSVGCVENRRFLQCIAYELQSNWQLLIVKAARYREPTAGAQIYRQGQHVGQIHADRIIDAFSHLESGGGTGWAGDDVNLLKSTLEMAAIPEDKATTPAASVTALILCSKASTVGFVILE